MPNSYFKARLGLKVIAGVAAAQCIVWDGSALDINNGVLKVAAASVTAAQPVTVGPFALSLNYAIQAKGSGSSLQIAFGRTTASQGFGFIGANSAYAFLLFSGGTGSDTPSATGVEMLAVTHTASCRLGTATIPNGQLHYSYGNMVITGQQTGTTFPADLPAFSGIAITEDTKPSPAFVMANYADTGSTVARAILTGNAYGMFPGLGTKYVSTSDTVFIIGYASTEQKWKQGLLDVEVIKFQKAGAVTIGTGAYTTQTHQLGGNLSSSGTGTSEADRSMLIGANYAAAGWSGPLTARSTSLTGIYMKFIPRIAASEATNASWALAFNPTGAATEYAAILAYSSGAVELGSKAAAAGLLHKALGNTTCDFRIDNNSVAAGAFAIASFYLNAINRGLIGSAEAGTLITGSATGDLCIRSDGVPLLFSTDTGSTIGGSISTASAWTLGQIDSTVHTMVANASPFLDMRNKLATGSARQMIRFYLGATGPTDGTSCGGVQTTDGASSPSFFTGTSDRRLKTKIEDDTTDYLSRICNVRLRTFEMLDSPGVRRKGVIAQELSEIYADHVHDRGDGYLHVSMGWDWDVIGAIQQLKKENDSLKRRLASIEGAA